MSNLFHDRNGRRIYAGVLIRNIHDGTTDKVYATQTQYGEESLGVSASNPAFIAAHPEWPEEFFGLDQFNLRSEWEIVTISYGELCKLFRQREAELAGRDMTEDGKTHLQAHIVVSADSFGAEYPQEARTYKISSNNKAYQPNMGGYSVYASSVDGSDPLVRLERYLAAEKGGKDGWKIDCCYLVES